MKSIDEYIVTITELLNRCDDIALLDLIEKLLHRS